MIYLDRFITPVSIGPFESHFVLGESILYTCIFHKFKTRPFNYDGDQNVDFAFAGEIKINLKLNKK